MEGLSDTDKKTGCYVSRADPRQGITYQLEQGDERECIRKSGHKRCVHDRRSCTRSWPALRVMGSI